MRIFLTATLAFSLVLTVSVIPVAEAAPTDVGFRDFSYAASGVSAPTGQKPQSKLWFADNAWWGALFSTGDSAFTVHRLDWNTQTWTNTGTVIDTRNSARVDALWDGTALYTVSATSGATGGAEVKRFDYDSGTRSYALAPGFPVALTTYGAESFVLDKDSTGTLWVTYTHNLAAYVTHSNGTDSSWVAPYVVPVAGASTLSTDDTSAVVAFGNSIGVMWSNQNDETMYFASHADGTPDDQWNLNPALTLPEYADDHINLKSLQATTDGRVFAATNTSLNGSAAPLILLLTLSAQGNWSRTTFGTVADNHTRPQLLLDEANDRIYLLAASPCCSGGTVYYKETSLSNPQFDAGLGTVFLETSQDPKINNISSTKQPLTAASGLVAIAGDDSTKFYLHNALSLGGAGDTDPPETTILTGPGAGTNETMATFTFTADELSSNFECTIDGIGFTPCTSPTTYSSLSVDPHHFEVRATDLAGNTDLTPAMWDWTVNASTTFLPVADTFVDAAAPTANFGSATSLSSDGGSQPEEAFLRFDVTGLSTPVQGAFLRVWVTNATGNGPEVFPASNAWDESTVTWNTKPASTGSAIFDAGNVGSGAWYEFDVSSYITGNGTFTLNLASVSTDGMNFSSREYPGFEPELVVVADTTADTTPPLVVSTNPVDGTVDVPIGTTVSALFSEAMDPATITASSFTLFNGASAIAAAVVYDNASRTATVIPDSPLSLLTTYTATITTAVHDLADNPMLDTVTWTFSTPASDIVPPETTITAKPAASTAGQSATFSFTSSEPSSTFECSIDGASFEVCSSPITYIGLGLGSHHFEVQATDPSDNTDLTPDTWDWSVISSASIDVAIASSNDDAEQRASGSVTVTSSDLELVEEAGAAQIVGLRFTGIPIPQGATIHNATVRFTTDEVSTDAASLTIRAESVDSASPFLTTSLNISTRATSIAAVDWSPPPWLATGNRGSAQLTPNLASLVQSAVSRSGWTTDNAIALIVDGVGSRVAESYDRSIPGAAVLHVEYDTLPPAVVPTVSSATPVSASPGAVVTILGSSFAGATEVAFNGVPASFAMVTDDVIEARVPISATTGPVSVTSSTGTGTSSTDFTVDPPDPLEVPGEYPTIQAAIDAASDGDTVRVAPGTYSAGLVINKTINLVSRFVSTGDPADIDGTIILSDGVLDGISIEIGAGPSTTIQGFTLTSPDPDPDPGLDGIRLEVTARIIDNAIRQFGDAIDFDPPLPSVASCICKRNVIEDNGDDAIDLDGAAEAVIEDNILRNNGDDGIEIRLQDHAGALTLTIRNNVITGNGQDGIQLIDEPGASDRRFLIEGNLIANNSRAGLGLMDNSVTTEDYRAASLPDSIHLINNTFSGNDHSLSGGDNLVAVNNIFANSDVGIKGVDGNSNVAYSLFSGNLTNSITSNIDASTRIDADPLFASDFTLLSGSPAIDAGSAFYQWQGQTVLDLQLEDYSGSAPDLGAFESEGPPDTTAPNVVATSPLAGETDVAQSALVSAVFSESMSPGDLTSSTFVLTVEGSPTSVPAIVTYDDASLTSTLVPTSPLDPDSTYEATISGGSGGVTDVAGNPLVLDYVWTFTTVSVDIDPPDTSISSGPVDPTNAISANFVFTSNEPGSIFECKLDGGVSDTCTSPHVLSTLLEGSHTFEVTATDIAGNTDPTPATWNWAVDLSAPDAPIVISPPDGFSNTTGDLDFVGTAEPNSLVTLSEGAVVVGTSSADGVGEWAISLASVANGPHSYSATATDPAGNESSQSPAVNVTVSDTSIVVMAAGDIACDPADSGFNGGAGTSTECRQMATSDLLLDPTIDLVLPLGDTQYECGGAQAYADSYDPSWGRAKSISRPAVGNHEYEASGGTDCDATGSAGPYFNYFGAAAGDPATGYYSYDVGTWHFVALNSECSQVGGCGAGSVQEQWLRADLAGSSASCTVAYMHRSRWSSGDRHGSNPGLGDLYTALFEGGVEVLLSGHDHNYERFAPQDPSGGLDAAAGVRSFVVGTGGKWLAPIGSPIPNSEVMASTFGVIQLTLNDNSYDWEFVPVAGESFTDAGSSPCHDVVQVPSDTTIDSSPEDLVTSTSASYEFSGSEAGATFECALDGGAFASCTSPHTYEGMVDGNHNFRVRAVDVDGNVDQSPASWDWLVDSSAVEFRFAAEADASVSSLAPDSNFGTAPTLSADLSPVERSYLRFDVTGLTGQVVGARLRTFAFSGTANGPDVFAVDNAWDELQITFNNVSSRTSSVLDSAGPIQSGAWVAYDVAAATAGNGLVSFEMEADSTDGVEFYSRDATDLRRPELVIFTTPNPVVSVTPTDPTGSEPGTDTGTLTVTRTGPTTTNLTVTYTVSGTATPGTDYTTLAGTVTIPTGQTATTITVTPLNDTTPEPDETVTITIDTDPTYTIATATGTATITDDDLPEVSIAFTPIADTYVDEGDPGVNFGSETSLSVDGNSGSAEEALVRFDVSGIAGPVQSATLRVYVTNSTSDGPEVFPTTNTWDEHLVTWATKPVATGSVIFDAGPILSGEWFEFDVTSGVTGNGTYSFNLKPQSRNGLNFTSREVSSTPPELVVTASAVPDTTPPTVTSTSPAPGAVDVSISSVVTAEFSEMMDPSSIDATSIVLETGGGSIPATVSYEAQTMTATLTPTSSLELNTLYAMSVLDSVTDLAGNPIATGVSWDFMTAVSDVDPPETSILVGPNTETANTAASFTFTSDEPASLFECELDGGGFNACSSPADYSNLSRGAHHFEVRATDPSSNTDPSPATWDWTVTTSSTYLSVADTYLNSSRQSTNYGFNNEVISDGGPQVKEALFRFDVSGFGGSVQSAVLRIYATNGSGNGPEVFLAENAWDEGTVTWATKPARIGPAAFDAGAIAAGDWYEFDVTALVGGDGTYTFNLVSVSTDAVKIRSREVAGFEPQLVLTSGQ
jgi:hypothetical protein